MKTFYSTILFIFAFATLVNAQLTTIDFTDASYEGIMNLNDHPDWEAESWTADGANDRLNLLKSNFKVCVYNKSIKNAVAGQVISIKALIQLGANTQAFQDAEAYLLTALQATTATSGSTSSTRDGLLLRSTDVAGNQVFIAKQGGGAFVTNPFISQADKDVYEVFFEITLGADGASSTTNGRVRNIVSGETSPIGTGTGINQVNYDAVTSAAGAYLFFYSFNSFNGTEGTDYNISNVFINEIELGIVTSGTLSTKQNNAFEFSMYPNPVKNELKINTLEAIDKVEVFDLLGKSVLSVNNVTESIDVSSLTSALYVVRLTSKNGVSTKKFIKD